MHKIIKELESDNSRLAKEAILYRELSKDNQTLFYGFQIALDKLVTFGVKQVPESFGDGPGISYGTFFMECAEPLANRTLTGHAARDRIIETMNKAKKDEWNYWYRRILLKDFKCGVSESTVNACVKKSKKSKYKVPVFKCMLAKDSKGHEKKLVGEKLIDYKLDGVRVVTIINPISKTVKHYSRNGKEFHNFGHITKYIEKFFTLFKEPVVIDGEMVSHSFQALMKQVQRKTDVNAQDAKYAIFDVLPLSEFKNGVSKLGCEKRHTDLKVLGRIISDENKTIFVVEKEKVNLDTKEGQKKFAQINKTALEKGFEGVMIKDPDGLYECKRSALMLKMKPFIEVSLEVKDVEEGTGKYEGTLGALVCEGTDTGKFIKVNVGSGITDEQRDEFWKQKKDIIGDIVEIRADVISKNQDDDHYSLRFPRFLSFRGFDKGEKV